MPDPEFDENRPSLLDAFGKADEAPPPAAMIPAAMTLPAQRAFGAIKVEVRRDERMVLQKLKTNAAVAGDDWFYRWPVKNKKTGKTDWVEGPSIKCANELGRIFGNNEVDTRVIDLGDSWLIYARFTDFETGFSMTRPFQQRKSQRTMGERATAEDADRSRDIAFQIGVSKAIRNVVVNALQGFADFAVEEAQNALVAKIGRDLSKWRDGTTRKLEGKVELRRVEAVIGRTAPGWLAPDVARVIALMRAVQDGMASIDETFPPLAAPTAGEQPASKLDEFARDADSDAASSGRAPDEASEGGATP